MGQPSWAVEPIVGCENAAKVIGVSLRKFIDIIKEHPHYEVRGKTYVFYPEHIRQIREGLKCQPTGNRSGTRKRKGGRSISQSKAQGIESVLAFVTEASRTPREKPQKPSTKKPGTVTSIR